MVLKAGPENAPHPPIPFCIKKFREHQKFGPLAQLGERKVRNLEVRGSIPLRSTKQVLDEHLFLQRRLRREMFALIHNRKAPSWE